MINNSWIPCDEINKPDYNNQIQKLKVMLGIRITRFGKKSRIQRSIKFCLVIQLSNQLDCYKIGKTMTMIIL